MMDVEKITIDLEKTYLQNWISWPYFFAGVAFKVLFSPAYAVDDYDVLGLLIVLSGIHVDDTSSQVEPFHEIWGANHWHFLREWAFETQEKKIESALKAKRKLNLEALDLSSPTASKVTHFAGPRNTKLKGSNRQLIVRSSYEAIAKGIQEQNIGAIILTAPNYENLSWFRHTHTRDSHHNPEALFELLEARGISIECQDYGEGSKSFLSKVIGI